MVDPTLPAYDRLCGSRAVVTLGAELASGNPGEHGEDPYFA
jgi:hypothetical protein